MNAARLTATVSERKEEKGWMDPSFVRLFVLPLRDCLRS
jgi:hypothetical protein